MNSSTRNLISAVLISVGCFVFWAWVLPTYDSLSSLSMVIKDRTGLLASREAIVAKIKNLNAEYQRRAEDLARFSLVVPEKSSIPELISATAAIASKNGLQLGTLVIGANIERDENIKYNTVSLNTGLGGDYFAMLNLLDTMEKSLRLIDMYELSVTPDESIKSASKLIFSIKARSYFLKDLKTLAKPKTSTAPVNKTNADNNQ